MLDTKASAPNFTQALSGTVPKDLTPVHKPVDSGRAARGAPAADNRGEDTAAGARRGLEPAAPRMGAEKIAPNRGPHVASQMVPRATSSVPGNTLTQRVPRLRSRTTRRKGPGIVVCGLVPGRLPCDVETTG